MERLREKSKIENEENNGKKAGGVGNKERVIAEFKGDADLRIRELDVKGGRVTVVHLDGLADSTRLSDFIVRAVLSGKDAGTLEDIEKQCVCVVNVKREESLTAMIDAMLMGNALLFAEGSEDALVLDTQAPEGRAIVEPPTSTVTNGPREGFVENIKKNIAMIRKRLKTTDFRCKNMNVGKYTQTVISVCYIEGVAKRELAEEICNKISKINIDGIIDSSYISRFIDGGSSKLFKTCGNTEKPDIAVAKMLEGRIVILADGSPIALTVPYMFIEDIQTAEDYFISPRTATVSRAIRLMAILASVFIPGMYVSLQLYNYQIIPLKFLLTIMNATQAIPLDPLAEMLFVLLLFDVIREANFRMPKFAGLALSIVGAVVLGDAAVKAGLLGAPAVVIGALSGIGLYAMPDNTILFTVLRFVFTLIGGVIGVFGIMIAGLIILIYLSSMNVFGTPYLAPFGPDIPDDRRDAVFKMPIDKLKNRPLAIGSRNKRRLNVEDNEKQNENQSDTDN